MIWTKELSWTFMDPKRDPATQIWGDPDQWTNPPPPVHWGLEIFKTAASQITARVGGLGVPTFCIHVMIFIAWHRIADLQKLNDKINLLAISYLYPQNCNKIKIKEKPIIKLRDRQKLKD